PFFKGKTVVVVGGGNSAIEGAQDISMHAEMVYLVSRSTLKAAPIYIDQLRSRKNIIEIADTNVLKINGDSKVISATLDRPYNNSNELKCDGLFVQIGYQPQSELAKKMGIKLSDYGYVDVDAGMGTNVSGVFCAGDINNGSNQLHQQVTSAAEGAISAQSAYRHIAGMSYLVTA
ncbi:MAG: thioredoxin reductase, partial [Patescibacteria group bacterium]|nr:thioredoxin reductase [Patescibacteria group bacterium]